MRKGGSGVSVLRSSYVIEKVLRDMERQKFWMGSNRFEGAGIVSGKPVSLPGRKKTPLYDRIRQILESARTGVARTVNTTQVVANWLIGREIVEEEQKGKKRAGYCEQLITELSEKLQKDFGVGYGTTNLKLFRQFFLAYPGF